MEELEKLFGDNLDALITLYKCCPSKLTGVYVEQLDPNELTNKQKLHIAKFTKSWRTRYGYLLICNWRLLTDVKDLDHKDIWFKLQEYVDKVSGVKKHLRKRSIDPKYLESLDVGEKEFLGVDSEEIYEKTGKIVPNVLIYKEEDEEYKLSEELENAIENVRETIFEKTNNIEDRVRLLVYLVEDLKDSIKRKKIEKENDLCY